MERDLIWKKCRSANPVWASVRLANRMQAFNGKVDISSSEEGSYINILFDIETLETV